MYICVCKGITDGQVKEAIKEGAHSLRDLRKSLGVASQCGKCALMTLEVLDHTLQHDSSLYHAVA